MPAFKITINQSHLVNIDLSNHPSFVRGIALSWTGGETANEDGLILFRAGGTDNNEQVEYALPRLSIGDEFSIQITNDTVNDSKAIRTTISSAQ